MLIRAFIRRDLRVELSYRVNFIWQVLSIGFSVAFLYFLSRMMEGNPPASVSRYGASYFEFAAIGYALAETMWAYSSAFSSQIRTEQVVGTLEAMMATPSSMPRILLGLGVYPLTLSTVRVCLYVGAAAVFGSGFSFMAVVRSVPVFVLTMATFGAIGLVSASFTLVLKRGDPVAALLGALSFLFGGAMYPVSALPDCLQSVSAVLPITHSIEAARRLLLMGQPLSSVTGELLILTGFALVGALAAFLSVRWALRLTAAGGGARTY